MATLNEVDGKKIMYVKGAPEMLLELCVNSAPLDGEEEIDAGYWEKEMEKKADNGQRLIAAAQKIVDNDKTSIEA
jgi:P-type Ca2+ transporter type 2C